MTKTIIITLAILTNLIAMDPELERPRATLYTKEGKLIEVDRTKRSYRNHPSFSNLVKNFAAKEIYKPKTKTIIINNEISNESIEQTSYGIVNIPNIDSPKWKEELINVIGVPVKKEEQLSNQYPSYPILRTFEENDKIKYEKLNRISFENNNPDPEEFIIISSTKNPVDEKKTIARIKRIKADSDETESDG